ncbi:YegP family protein [Natronococcus wangiae]|uniref:YegP family protein n=1 Tax=Natronococcus wangiae TaxID=3068275 RepID=UPI00387E4336
MVAKSTLIHLLRNVVVCHGVLNPTVEVISDLPLTGCPLIATSLTSKRTAGRLSGRRQEGNTGQWRWRLDYNNGNIIANSGCGYGSERDRGSRAL